MHMNANEVDPLYDRTEAEVYIRVKRGTLASWAHHNRYGLPFIKVGRLVRYRKSDLDKWLASRTQGGVAVGV
jgi:excisionase family DNA binding protein